MQKQKNYERKRFIGKGKYAIKLVDKPVIKLVGRIKDKSGAIVYIHKWM